jgi:hypothetical protein
MGEEVQYEEVRNQIRETAIAQFENWGGVNWFNIGPSWFPPNYYSRALTFEGQLARRDWLPKRAVTKVEYAQFGACDVKFSQILWEYTPNDKLPMAGNRMFLDVIRPPIKDVHFSFGSCHSCWKLSRRNFSDPEKTPYLTANADDPNLPRLGYCGCVCCNQCVREIELHKSNLSKEFVHCPYCGFEHSYSRHLRIWVISQQVTEAFERSEINESLKKSTGRKEDFDIAPCGDGHIIMLPEL